MHNLTGVHAILSEYITYPCEFIVSEIHALPNPQSTPHTNLNTM
jgi:hypothetical protein